MDGVTLPGDFSNPWFAHEWDQYYQRNTHTKWWPSEEVVRILSACKSRSRDISKLIVGILGCGNGRHCWLAARLGFGKVIGVDISATALSLGRQWMHRESLSVEFIENHKGECPVECDVLVCHGVLDHMLVEQGQELFENAMRGVRPGGVCILGCKSTQHTENGSGAKLADNLYMAPTGHQEAGIPQRFFTREDLYALVSKTAVFETVRLHRINHRIEQTGADYERLVLELLTRR